MKVFEYLRESDLEPTEMFLRSDFPEFFGDFRLTGKPVRPTVLPQLMMRVEVQVERLEHLSHPK